MIEMVALEEDADLDWAAAERYIGSLVLEELDDELVQLCGVDTENDARETWLETVQERLLSDLACFREDTETDRDEIEQWELGTTRIFASVGDWEDEADLDSGHGWMCRLVDSGALAAAGFRRLRKAEL